MIVEFKNDRIELYEVDEEMKLDVPVIDMTVDCPASIVDVANSSSEHDSVQTTSEVV